MHLIEIASKYIHWGNGSWTLQKLYKMHLSMLNCVYCNSLIGGRAGQTEGRSIGRVSRTMHCFPKLQEPRYEMGPILMTLALPNTLQLSACQQVILARSPEAWGPSFEGMRRQFFQGGRKPRGSHFYLLSILPHFLNWPSNPQFVGSLATEEIDEILESNWGRWEVIHVFFVM